MAVEEAVAAAAFSPLPRAPPASRPSSGNLIVRFSRPKAAAGVLLPPTPAPTPSLPPCVMPFDICPPSSPAPLSSRMTLPPIIQIDLVEFALDRAGLRRPAVRERSSEGLREEETVGRRRPMLFTLLPMRKGAAALPSGPSVTLRDMVRGR